MKTINQETITQEVKRLCQEANYVLPQDVYQALKEAYETEDSLLSKQTLEVLHKNAQIARETCSPICQDTGMACVFVEIGQDVHIEGSLNDRINTKDNTPAIINYDIVEGDQLKIIVAPKGFGSENMSQIKMLKPSDGVEGIKEFVLKVINDAGPNACPPMVIGVGIGGSFDKVTLLAKKAMLREIGSHHPDKRYSDLENELLNRINHTGIGPAGYGGKTTALSLNIETYPTHIAGMPVAVSICCHVARHKEVIL